MALAKVQEHAETEGIFRLDTRGIGDSGGGDRDDGMPVRVEAEPKDRGEASVER